MIVPKNIKKVTIDNNVANVLIHGEIDKTALAVVPTSFVDKVFSMWLRDPDMFKTEFLDLARSANSPGAYCDLLSRELEFMDTLHVYEDSLSDSSENVETQSVLTNILSRM